MDELGALNEIATAIGSSQSLEDVNNRIVKMVVKRARATQGAIFLLSEKNEKPMVTEVRVKDSSVEEDTARFGKLITGRVIKEQAPLNISRARDPEGLLARMPEFVTSVLSVPVRVHRPLGTAPEANSIWALDFVHDALYVGRRFSGPSTYLMRVCVRLWRL